MLMVFQKPKGTVDFFPEEKDVQDKVFDKHCPTCGLALYEGDGGCPKCKYKKAPRVKNDKKSHGRSKSPARFYNQEQD